MNNIMRFEHLLLINDDKIRQIQDCESDINLSSFQKKYIKKAITMNKNIIYRPDFFSRIFLRGGEFFYTSIAQQLNFENLVRREIVSLNLNNTSVIA